MYNPIRPGNRGGQDQFKWASLTTMSYKDRDQYLGYTTKIGYLDKGGKWRKKDWYCQSDNLKKNAQNVQDEIKKAQEADQKRIRVALGIEKPSDQYQNLSQQQLNDLNQKIKQSNPDDPETTKGENEEENNQNQGLGFEIDNETLKQINIKKLNNKSLDQLENIYHLEGENNGQDNDHKNQNKQKKKKDKSSPIINKKISKDKNTQSKHSDKTNDQSQNQEKLNIQSKKEHKHKHEHKHSHKHKHIDENKEKKQNHSTTRSQSESSN